MSNPNDPKAPAPSDDDPKPPNLVRFQFPRGATPEQMAAHLQETIKKAHAEDEAWKARQVAKKAAPPSTTPETPANP